MDQQEKEGSNVPLMLISFYESDQSKRVFNTCTYAWILSDVMRLFSDNDNDNKWDNR